MQNESRVHKSIMNAKVSLIFYVISIALSFFSRKIFLGTLGAEFIGLGGTISEILRVNEWLTALTTAAEQYVKKQIAESLIA